jgi:hypothetical protein
MACYLCAYGLNQKPKSVTRILPPTSAVANDATLGTCRACNVHACSQHGSLYSQFRCAICSPAPVAQATLTQPPGGASANDSDTAQRVAVAAILARLLPSVREVDIDVLRRGLTSLIGEYRNLAAHRELGGQLPQDNATLIGGLGGWLNSRYARDIRDTSDELVLVWRRPVISPVDLPDLDHRVSIQLHNQYVGIAVRQSLSAAEPRSDDELGIEDVETARGAIGLAYLNASEHPDASDWHGGADRFAVGGLVPPWRLDAPGAVHPIVWLLAAAYIRAQEPR